MQKTRVAIATCALVLAALSLAGCQSRGATSNEPLDASGTIEAEEVRVAPEVGGRIVELAAEEGAVIESGAVLVRLDAALLQAQRDQARSVLRGAQGALDAAQAQLARARAGARPQEVTASRSVLLAAEAGLKAAQAQREAAQAHHRVVAANLAAAEAQYQVAQAGQAAAQAGLEVARAGLAKAEAGATGEETAIAERAVEVAKNALWGAQAQRDTVCGMVGRGGRQADCDAAKAGVQQAEEEARIAELQLEQVRKGARSEDLAALRAGVSQAQAGLQAAGADADKARSQVDAAQAALALAAASLAEVEAGLDAARAQRDQAQAALDLLLAGAREEEIAYLDAQVLQAEAALAGAGASLRAMETQLSRMVLAAPVRGVVVARSAHVGELAAPGVPIYTLSDLDHLTLTVYIPEPDLGRVALQQEVRVTVDAYPGTDFRGLVTRIASRAEFTPKNVETREERVNMVFAVEIALEDGEGRLRPGMPADALFAPQGR